MRIEIKPDPEHQRSPIKAPPNYQSLRMRLKLLSLFAALILVLILMQEAKKPERWRWLGFQENAVPAAKSDRTVAAGEQGSNAPETQIGDSLAPPQTKSAELAGLIAAASQSGREVSESPLASQQFWRETFARLNLDERRQLLRFVSAVSQRTPLEPDRTADFAALVTGLDDKHERFHRRLLDEISLLDDSGQKRKLNDELSESQKLWEHQILPSWQSTLQGEDITMAGLMANQSLHTLLCDLAFEQVEDGSSLNRPGEGSAWLLAWEHVLSPEKLTPSIAVTHVQLSGQPAAYRGKLISINGWIRATRELHVAPNELGLDHYYVLWLRPEDTNVGPYCVYAQRLPDGFPNGLLPDSELNERVEVTGVFFKIRTYTAANGEVLHCPLILADSFQWKPVAAESAVDSWTPSWWLLVGFLIAMPILAGIVAWWAFASTETRRFVHGPNAQREIDEALVELEKDPDIKSDLERVQSLYDDELQRPHDAI